MDDRPCWGEIGLPLLPSHWQPWLPNHPIEPEQTDQGHQNSFSLHSLCSPEDWSCHFRTRTGLDVAVEAFTDLLDGGTDLGFMDTPLSAGQFQDPKGVDSIPFLTSTWQSLRSVFGDDQSIATMLTKSTCLELLDMTDSVSAMLDTAITAPSWIDESEDGFLTSAMPVVPKSVGDAFNLAGLRHLRAACVSATYMDPNSPWFRAFAGFSGISVFDNRLTVAQAAQWARTTRDEFQQVANSFPLLHSIQRRWPLSHDLERVWRALERADGKTCGEVTEEINLILEDPVPLTVEKANRLLSFYGQPTNLAVDITGLVRPKDAILPIPDGLTLDHVRQMIWKLSERTGFLREHDLARELMRQYPELDRDLTTALLDVAVDEQRLSDDYLFFEPDRERPEEKGVQAVLLRMLAWADHLSLQDLYSGLVRKFKARGLPLPPPVGVIRTLVERLNTFDIENDVVSTQSAPDRETQTNSGWVSQQLHDAELGVLHRSAILEAARQAGRNPRSIASCLDGAETITPLGRRCFALIGTKPSETSIRDARAVALSTRMKSEVKYSYPTAGIRLEIKVGHELVAEGRVPVGPRVQRLIANRELAVSSQCEEHGHLRTRNGLLTGLSAALAALAVEPEDHIVVEVDLDKNTAHIEYLDNEVEN